MMEGYQKGIITEEHLQDALMRILGLKAYLGLHKKKNEIVPPKEGLSVIGSEEFKKIAKEGESWQKLKEEAYPKLLTGKFMKPIKKNCY